MDISFDPRTTSPTANRIFHNIPLLDSLIALVSRVARAVFETISWVLSLATSPCSALFASAPPQVISTQPLDPTIQAVLDRAPVFAEYRIGQGTPYQNTKLTSVTVRPSNLFFNALLGENSTTMPGSRMLFAFNTPYEQIRESITSAHPESIVAFTANGTAGGIYHPTTGRRDISNLADLYGPATFRFSLGEIQSILNSQKIAVAEPLPLIFYQALKVAMLKDGIVTLPGSDSHPIKVGNLNTPKCSELIRQVRARPLEFGFESLEDCNHLLDLTLYQLGSLVVKSEDFYIFLDANGKIRERNPGENDAIRLINACGIRGPHSTPSVNRNIMDGTFKTALEAAESGFVVFPAVGMGVWGGDPNLYWRAFFDAVILKGAPFEKIFVNPNHQPTRSGHYTGYKGEEFQTILNEYREQLRAINDDAGLANLDKIVNLFTLRKDIVHLSQALKIAFPDKIVSLFNASDPDVTLGNHVGEYVNNLNHPCTTEENYTALGSNGLCFETITGVHKRSDM